MKKLCLALAALTLSGTTAAEPVTYTLERLELVRDTKTFDSKKEAIEYYSMKHKAAVGDGEFDNQTMPFKWWGTNIYINEQCSKLRGGFNSIRLDQYYPKAVQVLLFRQVVDSLLANNTTCEEAYELVEHYNPFNLTHDEKGSNVIDPALEEASAVRYGAFQKADYEKVLKIEFPPKIKNELNNALFNQDEVLAGVILQTTLIADEWHLAKYCDEKELMMDIEEAIDHVAVYNRIGTSNIRRLVNERTEQLKSKPPKCDVFTQRVASYSKESIKLLGHEYRAPRF